MDRMKGFSLLSLMISTTIGIFIMGAAGQVYVNSKSVFNARTAVSITTESGRYAISDLRRVLIMTGREVPASITPFPAVDANGIVDGGASGSDIVGVRYASGTACDSEVSSLTTIRFKIEDDTLICEQGGTDYPLVSGIKLMRVLYGVNDNTDGYANRYLNATTVETEGKWGNVVSLRIGLVVSSEDYKLPGNMQEYTAQTLVVLGQSYTAPDTEHVFQVASTTISLRNLNTVVSRQ